MLESLRNHGYTLFTNAITTSDLQYQLLATTHSAVTTSASSAAGIRTQITLHSVRPYELLFALDMASDADVYVSTLRYHVIPNRRHTFADLQNLSSPFLETLLPHYSVLIGKTRDGYVLFDNASVGLMVDGVRLSDPDLFLGSRIAVHGIDGILLTGQSVNQDFDRNDNGSDLFSPAESPAPISGLDRNIPAEGTLIPPISQFGKENASAAPAPPVGLPSDGQTQAAPPLDGKTPAAPPLEGNSPAALPFNWETPVAPPSDGETPMGPPFDGKSPAAPPFEWENPVGPPLVGKAPAAPPLDGKTPVALPFDGKIKRGRRRRRGGGHRRKPKGFRRHRLDDL
ncbi:LOW QUALITY PROTEIN: hypothetical protein DH2020_047848 [Rehmannia glutinosa]|uniref:FHA domain-containing protein n=1 Tax=Rehmannia glutinosa TaxID=99300 RepID=A0ABR0U7I3_REHGL